MCAVTKIDGSCALAIIFQLSCRNQWTPSVIYCCRKFFFFQWFITGGSVTGRHQVFHWKTYEGTSLTGVGLISGKIGQLNKNQKYY